MASHLPTELLEPRQAVEEARELWTESWATLTELEFPVNTDLRAIGDGKRDLEQINDLILAILEYVAAAKFAKGFSLALVPDQLLEQFRTNADSIRTAVQSFGERLAQVRASGGLQRFDPNQLIATTGRGQSVQLQELKQLYTGTQALLRSFLAMYPALRSGTAVDLSKRARTLQDLSLQASTALEVAENHNRQLEVLVSGAETENTRLSGLLDEAGESAEEVTKAKTTAEDLVADAKAAVAQVRETATAAEGLQKKVDESSADLDEFKRTLSERMEKLAEANRETDRSEERNTKRESEIDRLTEKADAMLKGASVAGFASSFGDSHQVFNEELKRATIGFWVAIGLLIGSVLPLAFYVLEGPEWLAGLLGTGQGAEAPITLEGLLARLALLLPTVWLTRFYSRRYSRLFGLREEYAHKEALARSIEGFRREAPEYQNELTAAVFWDLTRRGRRQAGHDDVPNPLLKRLLDRLEGETEDSESKQSE